MPVELVGLVAQRAQQLKSALDAASPPAAGAALSGDTCWLFDELQASAHTISMVLHAALHSSYELVRSGMTDLLEDVLLLLTNLREEAYAYLAHPEELLGEGELLEELREHVWEAKGRLSEEIARIDRRLRQLGDDEARCWMEMGLPDNALESVLALHSVASFSSAASLRVVRSIALLVVGSPEEQAAAGAALAELAGEGPGQQAAIAAAGGILLLVELLECSSSAAVQRSAAAALGSLAAGNPANQAAVAAADGIRPLVELLGNSSCCGIATASSEAQQQQQDAREAVQEAAVAALCQLAQDCPPCQLAIAAADGIPALRALLGSQRSAMQQHAVALCAALSQDSAHRDALAACGGTGALVRLLLMSKSEGLRRLAAAALANLAWECPTRQAAILAADGMAQLTQLLSCGVGNGGSSSAAQHVAGDVLRAQGALHAGLAASCHFFCLGFVYLYVSLSIRRSTSVSLA